MKNTKRILQLLSGALCVALSVCYVIMFKNGTLIPTTEGLDGAVVLLFNLFFGVLGIILLIVIGVIGILIMIPTKRRGKLSEKRLLTLFNLFLEVIAGFAFYIWSTMEPISTQLVVLLSLTAASVALQLISLFLKHPRPAQ